MSFVLDPVLASSTIEVSDWPLCKVLLKNEKNYPWLLLVPKRTDVEEIHQLSSKDQQQFIREMSRASACIKQLFSVDKVNTAAIGNQVPQLHLHVVGRYKTDPLWPQSIWQSRYVEKIYPPAEFQALCEKLQQELRATKKTIN